MSVWNVPWIEFAILVPLVGAVWSSRFRNPDWAFAWGLTFTGLTLICTILEWLAIAFGDPNSPQDWSGLHALIGQELLVVDALSAPLVTVGALLHFLTALATGRTKIRRFSVPWTLFSEAVRLATLSCKEPWWLIAFLAVGTLQGYVELVNRRKPTRVFVLHMALSIGLMVLGWVLVEAEMGPGSQPGWITGLGAGMLLAGILIRCGIVPAHLWLIDWFEHASFGHAILFVAPLTGVYAAVRLVLPIAPDWVLSSIGLFSLITAVYAAGMAMVQREGRRFFAYLFLSNASLVLVGLELHTPISLTGALALWISVPMSLGGLGLTLRALEARFGRLSMAGYRGLYDHAPGLAVCFLLTGLASVGFPGTLGFVATELLTEGTIEASPLRGLAVVAASAINGIAIVRAYFLLFTGTIHASSFGLEISRRERFAVLALALLILGGGMFPQPMIASRHTVALALLAGREARYPPEEEAK